MTVPAGAGRNLATARTRDFELPGDEALMRKEGDALIIVPRCQRSPLEALESLEPLRDKFPPIRDRPAEPVDL